MANTIDAMNAFMTEAAAAAAEQNADDDGLPFETIDAFSTDPIGFEDLSARMLARVEQIFDQTVLYNRHSAGYLKACTLLERGIKYLGSACLTKIALEKKKNISFTGLRQLSTDKLYRMASFNFRKIDAALTEDMDRKHEMTETLLDMQFRYYNLLQRLRSTEVKIYNYCFKLYYETEDYTPVLHGNAFSTKSSVRHYTKEHAEPPAFRNAPAFPMLPDSRCRVSGAGDQQKDESSGNEVMPEAEINTESLNEETESCQVSDAGDQQKDESPERGIVRGKRIAEIVIGNARGETVPEKDRDAAPAEIQEEDNSLTSKNSRIRNDTARTPLDMEPPFELIDRLWQEYSGLPPGDV